MASLDRRMKRTPASHFGRLLIVATWIALPDPISGWWTVVAGWAAVFAWDYHVRRILEPST